MSKHHQPETLGSTVSVNSAAVKDVLVAAGCITELSNTVNK